MNKVVLKTVGIALSAVGAVGSTFIRRDSDGKYSVAIAPFVLAGVIGAGATCAAQDTEPFGQCFKDSLTTLKEYVYAN